MTWEKRVQLCKFYYIDISGMIANSKSRQVKAIVRVVWMVELKWIHLVKINDPVSSSVKFPTSGIRKRMQLEWLTCHASCWDHIRNIESLNQNGRFLVAEAAAKAKAKAAAPPPPKSKPSKNRSEVALPLQQRLQHFIIIRLRPKATYILRQGTWLRLWRERIMRMDGDWKVRGEGGLVPR